MMQRRTQIAIGCERSVPPASLSLTSQSHIYSESELPTGSSFGLGYQNPSEDTIYGDHMAFMKEINLGLSSTPGASHDVLRTISQLAPNSSTPLVSTLAPSALNKTHINHP